jgi:hypothetical protein
MDRLPDSTRGSAMRKYASEAGLLRAARQGPHGRSLTARTAHNMSASALRKKSDASLVRKVPFAPLRPVLANLQEVFLGTKLAVLFPAVPLAIAAQCANFGQVYYYYIPAPIAVQGLIDYSCCFLSQSIGRVLLTIRLAALRTERGKALVAERNRQIIDLSVLSLLVLEDRCWRWREMR